jgi:hypothetical protein
MPRPEGTAARQTRVARRIVKVQIGLDNGCFRWKIAVWEENEEVNSESSTPLYTLHSSKLDKALDPGKVLRIS